MADAVIQWASKDEAVVRTLEKTERGFDGILRKLDQIERRSKDTTQAINVGFDASIAKVDQFVRGFVGFGTALAGIRMSADLIKREYEAMVQRQKAALDANLALADVLPATFRQAGGLLTGREVTESVSRVSKETGVDQVRVAQAIGEALAARGATNKAEAQGAIDAAAAALKFAPEADAQTIASLAGGTTDLQRRFNISPQQAIGFLARVGGQARVTSLREQVQNINPAIGGLAAFGMAPDAAGGLVSALTGASGDFTGAMSGTSAIQLAKQLQDRGFATPEAGIAAMQADPKLREAFFKGGKFGGRTFAAASFESRMFPFIRELLTGGSGLAQNFAAASREVGTFAQGGRTYDEMIAEIGGMTPTALAAGERRGVAATGRFQAGQTRDARIAAVRQRMSEALGSVNFAGLDIGQTMAARGLYEYGMATSDMAPEIAGAGILERLAGNAQSQGRLSQGDAGQLREQAAILRQMLAELQKANADAPQQRDRPAQALGR